MIDLYMLCMDLKNQQSYCAQQSKIIIHDIYEIINAPSAKTQRVIDGWTKDFRYIYGDVDANLSSNNKLDTKVLLNKYMIKPVEKNEARQTQLLFYAIQTYFSVLIKVMMQDILAYDIEAYTEQDVIRGRFAQEKGIKNYCNPDWYSWPEYEMDNGFSDVMNKIRISVSHYRSVMSLEDFAGMNNYDYIKQMYEAIIPRELRHALGEYYTPDWLADETLNTVLTFDNADINQCFIDPTCGSGTFLIKVIMAKRKAGFGVQHILNTVKGIDINPLAVLTAKTNYLLAIVDIIGDLDEIEIPVFNSDIITIDNAQKAQTESDTMAGDDPQLEIVVNMRQERERAATIGKAEIIIGNPPWVNWEYMPEEYRVNSQHLWIDYNLFSAKGRDLSFSKEDISVLITYIVLDKLLNTNGILAFVIRQGVFKSAQNGVGFRRFRLKDECGINVLRVDDLSKIRAFDNATNSTALVYLKKNSDTQYPVPYYLWEKRDDLKSLSFNSYSELRAVKGQMVIKRLEAMPAVAEDPTSLWLTADKNDLAIMNKVLGKNAYKARTGVFTGGANAVYWLEISKTDGADIEVSNIVERAKRKSERITRTIEPTYVFPMLKGSNVKRWNVNYDTYLLCPHTAETKMWPVRQDVLKEESPKTYEYLCYFKDDLDGRKGFAGWEKEIQTQEFQAVLRVGEYTFSSYKVIWKYIASEFICAVVGSVEDPFLGKKILIPNEKIMYVSTENEDEAYYLCGVLSSSMVANCVKSYMNPTSISAHVLDKLNIPDFDATNNSHIEIARICKAGHGKQDISNYIKELDRVVSLLYS